MSDNYKAYNIDKELWEQCKKAEIPEMIAETYRDVIVAEIDDRIRLCYDEKHIKVMMEIRYAVAATCMDRFLWYHIWDPSKLDTMFNEKKDLLKSLVEKGLYKEEDAAYELWRWKCVMQYKEKENKE